MEEKKKENNKLVIVLIIAVVIFGGIIVKQVIDFNSNDNSNTNTPSQENQSDINNSNETDSNNKSEESTNSDSEISITDGTILNLYDYIPHITYGGEAKANDAYQSKKIYITDLSDDVLKDMAWTAFRKLKVDFENNPDNYTCYEYCIDIECSQKLTNVKIACSLGDWYYFDINYLKNKTFELYNKEILIDEHSSCGSSIEKNNNYYVYTYGGGCTGPATQSTRKIVKAYYNNSDIIIEDIYAFMKPEDDHYVLYNSSEMTTKLTEENVDWFESNDNILSKYENRMKKYKHTFKKNTNGTYYWYSTEPINK